MSSKILRVGFVGAGAVNFGGVEGPWDHASRLEKLGGVEVVGIADIFPEKAQEILDKRLAGNGKELYQNCKIYKGHDQMLADANLDVVIIGTAPLHRGSPASGKDLELTFIKAGVHCFIEKPLSVEIPESFMQYVQDVEKCAVENNVITSVGYMFRYHAAVNKMKELIQKHGGKVMSFNGRYYLAYSAIDRSFWWNINKSGGPIVEQATHFCDLARYIVGDVDHSSIQTTALHADDASGTANLSAIAKGMETDLSPAERVPRVTATQWRFKSGGIGSLMHAVALHGKRYESQIEVLLDGLRLTLYEPYHPECRLLVRDSNSDYETSYDFGSDDPYLRELQVFLEAVRSGDKSQIASSYSDAAQSYAFTWAIRRAGEVNK